MFCVVVSGFALVAGCRSVRIVEIDNGSDNKPANVKAKHHPSPASKQGATKKADASKPAGSIESAVLFVNHDHITAEDVITRVLPSIKAYASRYDESSFYPKSVELVSRMITDMVSEMLLYQEMSARLSDSQNPAVEKAVDKAIRNMVQSQAGGSMMRFEKQLDQDGMTLDSLRLRLRKQILAQQYLRDQLRPKVVITRDDLWRYYESHKKDYLLPARVHVYMIEISFDKFLPAGVTFRQADKGEKELARQIAERKVILVAKRLAAGENFATVAKDLSTSASGKLGGDIGWITRGSYKIKKIEDVAFNLAPGEVSEPITIGRKIYILKLAGRQDSRKISFCEAQSKIRRKLRHELYNRLVNEHLMKLWKKSQIGSIQPFARIVMSRLPDYKTLRKK